jgi:predicted porin
MAYGWRWPAAASHFEDNTMPVIRSARLAAAAALLCGAASAAHAQFDYSVNGVADLSFGSFAPSGFVQTRRFNSNSLTATFVGLNASYGLENGFTPGITLESFYRFQDSKFGRRDDDPILSRNAFLSLTHRDYGTLRAGRIQTLLFSTTARFNALGSSLGFSPVVRHIFAAGNLIGVQGDFYWNEAIGYTTPNFDGITGSVMTAHGKQDNRGNLFGGNLIVSKGVLAGSLSMQRVNINNSIDDPTLEETVQVGASYNLGVAKLFGQYTHINDLGLEVNSDIVSAGVSVPLGPGTVLAQIANSKAEGLAVLRKQTTMSMGYVYAYDSLTDIYVITMHDQVLGQTRGLSSAIGVRYSFQ